MKSTKELSETAPSEANTNNATILKSQMDSLDKILKCLNILLDVAAQSNRNIIIDQVSKIAQINSRNFEYIFVKYY